MSRIADRAPYKDPHRPVDERVEDLLARMTLEEKVAQLGSAWVFEVAPGNRFSREHAERRLQHGIGQITRVAGASDARPREAAALANQLQRYLVERTRLGIPAIVHEECCAGLMARGATLFPQMIGLASTWEPELATRMAERIRQQMRALGAHQGLAPLLDVARDPRWGRIEETFGEDPWLVAQMGMAYVRGLQGDEHATGVLATGKHFVAYGVPEGGLNWAPAHVGERELREVYLFPFEAAVREAGLAAIMPGYHELDGVPVSSEPRLVGELLRREWDFRGLVVSDYEAVDNLRRYHRVAQDKAEAAALALEAGIDVELPSADCYAAPLLDAVRAGRVPLQQVDDAARRVLRAKLALGLFEHPYVDEERAAVCLDTPEDRALAREIARRSLVLLKNDEDLLPLPRDLRRLAVIGPAAPSRRLLCGDYHYPAHVEVYETLGMGDQGVAPVRLPRRPEGVSPEEWEARTFDAHFTRVVPILDAIRGCVGPGTEVLYARGCDVSGDEGPELEEAVEAARRADVAVVVVGERSGLAPACTCGEFRDRAGLGLCGAQERLVEAVAATGTPTVLVLVAGRPLALPHLVEKVRAILAAWVPGEEGGPAVADVLFGLAAPGGKLPVSIPRHAGQVPIFHAHKPTGGRSHVYGDYVDVSVRPLFPFGHGLTYTRFEYGELRIEPERVGPDGKVSVTVTVTNAGPRAGDETVQLYLGDPVASVTRPVRLLRGFKRVTLGPGQRAEVRFVVEPRHMAFYDRSMQLVVEPGEVEVMVGSSSQELRCHGRFCIAGPRTVVDHPAFTTPLTVA